MNLFEYLNYFKSMKILFVFFFNPLQTITFDICGILILRRMNYFVNWNFYQYLHNTNYSKLIVSEISTKNFL